MKQPILKIEKSKSQIDLKSLSEPRQGWDEAFKEMHKNNDDQLLMDDVFDDETFVD